MREEFIQAIKTHQIAFGLDLSDPAVARLGDYYELVIAHNPLLHLVGPCSSEDFAIRHILESLTLLEYLPTGARFADVGAGAGLPSIPCLLVREDLKAVLIESKEKKARFLTDAMGLLGFTSRAIVINRQYEEANPDGCEYVACRALDKFTGKLPRIIKWSRRRSMLLFGGDNLKIALSEQKVMFTQKLTPLSEQRFLFVVSAESGR